MPHIPSNFTIREKTDACIRLLEASAHCKETVGIIREHLVSMTEICETVGSEVPAVHITDFLKTHAV